MRSQSEQITSGAIARVYAGFSLAVAPIVGGALACTSRGRRRMGERFGSWGSLTPLEWWFHGASVGEVQGLIPLMKAVNGRAEGSPTLLTSTSPTGLDRGASHVTHTRVLPLDSPFFVRRALERVSVRRFVLAETELWPSLLSELHRRGVPCHVVNGRISDYTFKWYRTSRALFAPLLSRFASVSVVSEEHAERFIELGAMPERVRVIGHTKYDTEPRVISAAEQKVIRERFFPVGDPTTPVVVLGSVRPGEEEGWFHALAGVQSADGARCRAIVVPRHLERVDYFEERLRAFSLPFSRWSDRERGATGGPEIVLLDAMGLLEEAYSIADLAFVGGTLVDIGGHNPVEPAMYGVPVVVGPYTSVIRDVVVSMREVCGIIEIASAEGIPALLRALLERAGALREVGVRGQQVWSRHRGAVQRALSVIVHEGH